MSEFSRVLGSLLSSVAHARRIADEETAILAEYYRSQPLLEGLSLPRVRVAETIIDLPVVIEHEDPGTPEILESLRLIKTSVSARLITAAETEGVKLPMAMKERFEQQLDSAFRRCEMRTRGDVVRAVERAFHSAIQGEPVERLKGESLAAVSRAILQEARDVAVKKERIPPSFKVTVRTADIKEQSDRESVTRVKLVLHEEGLEWAATTDDDGTIRRFLTPE